MMIEFANDMFSVAYPAGWAVMPHPDGSGATLASSGACLERFRARVALEPGDRALTISLTPAALFQALYMTLEPGASAEELSAAVLTRLGTIKGTQATEAEIVALADGREVALQRAANADAEGAVVLFEISKGVIALNSVAGCPGEYKAAESSALAILAALDFSGTAEALTGAIAPVPPAEFLTH
jgi:hypothetical protein